MKRNITVIAGLIACFFVFQSNKPRTAASEPAASESVVIGSQTWAPANLRVTAFRNGDPIPQAQTPEQWLKAAELKMPAWCYNEAKTAEGEEKEILYNYYAVSDPRRLAPEGWQLPDETDMKTLFEALGGPGIAGDKMKSKQLKGNNESGFHALPAGMRNEKGVFSDLKSSARFWLTDESGENTATEMTLTAGSEKAGVTGSIPFACGMSVRCLKDKPEAEGKCTAADGSVHYTVTIGDQVWFAQNLTVTKFRNGAEINQARSNLEWQKATELKKPVWAYAYFDEANKKYGKIYNYYALTDPRGLAPAGYHIPDNSEWEKLVAACGGESKAGNALRSAYGWSIEKPEHRTANNSSGFCAFPLDRIWDDGSYGGTATAEWWSLSLVNDHQAWNFITSSKSGVFKKGEGDELGSGRAVRCVRD